MNISYSGVISVYTFNCPFAHKLKNIERVVIEPKEEQENPEEISRRMRGIELHDQLAKYLQHEVDEFPFVTPYIDYLYNSSEYITVETTDYYGLDMSPLPCKPNEGNYISTRKDVVVRTPTFTTIYDAKFGNPDYGITKHIDECEFFLACESSAYSDVGFWEIVIEFPEHNYIVPRKPYMYTDVTRLQQKFLNRIDLILNDKYLKPNPTRATCRFCSYRSEESMGSGHCPYTVI